MNLTSFLRPSGFHFGASILRQVEVPLFEQVRHLNANRAVVAKVRRNVVTRTYPTTLVLPDGSSIQIRYPTPRGIIKLPFEIMNCSPADIRRIKQLRRPRGTVKKEEDLENMSFNPMKYVKK